MGRKKTSRKKVPVVNVVTEDSERIEDSNNAGDDFRSQDAYNGEE